MPLIGSKATAFTPHSFLDPVKICTNLESRQLVVVTSCARIVVVCPQHRLVCAIDNTMPKDVTACAASLEFVIYSSLATPFQVAVATAP